MVGLPVWGSLLTNTCIHAQSIETNGNMIYFICGIKLFPEKKKKKSDELIDSGHHNKISETPWLKETSGCWAFHIKVLLGWISFFFFFLI